MKPERQLNSTAFSILKQKRREKAKDRSLHHTN